MPDGVPQRLLRDASRIAKTFRLKFKNISPDHPRAQRLGAYGQGVIYLRTHRLGSSRALTYRTMLLTLCHELAHTVYFLHDHRHYELERALWIWAQRNGLTKKH